MLFTTHSRSLNDATLLIANFRSDKINWQQVHKISRWVQDLSRAQLILVYLDDLM